MATTYKWEQPDEPADEKQRTIVKEEPVPATKTEEKFTLAQKEDALATAEQAIVDAEAKVADLIKEIADIKTALEIA